MSRVEAWKIVTRYVSGQFLLCVSREWKIVCYLLFCFTSAVSVVVALCH